MTTKAKIEIEKLLQNIVTDTIQRTVENLKKDKKPFHKALLSEDVIKLSSFERSFSTSFGQKYIEEISYLIALDAGYKAEKQKITIASIYQGALDEIDRVIDDLKSNRTKPDWNNELSYILAHNKGRTVTRKITSDLWIEKNGTDHFFSIKTVKPNLDQTRIAKHDMLILKANDPACNPYFALYYNPTGKTQSDYTYSTPNKYFKMKSDPCVLIGEDYWDFIGGPGTFKELIQIFNVVGIKTIAQVKQMKL